MATRRVVRRSGAATAAPTKKASAAKAAPSKSASRARDDDDYDDVDDDEEEEVTIRSGWGAAEQTMDSTSSFAQNFKMSAQTQIVRFTQDTPYASYRRHWVERPGIGTRAFTCLETVGRDCPLCDVGDKPQAVAAFNIFVVSDDGTVSHKSWDTTPTVTRPLMTFARDQKIGPLNRPGLYFAVSKPEAKRKFDRVTPLISPVRERDLEEDFEVTVPKPAAINKAMKSLYTSDIIPIPKTRELQDVVDDMVDEDERPSGWDQDEDDRGHKPPRRRK